MRISGKTENEISVGDPVEPIRLKVFMPDNTFSSNCQRTIVHSFQFAPSMQTMLTFLLAGLATYYETYNRSIPYAAASLATAPKYLLFPEQRAKKVRTRSLFSTLLFKPFLL